MNRHLIPLLAQVILLLGICGQPLSAVPAPTSGANVEPPLSKFFDWSSSAKAANYSKARADTPMYEDKQLWPFLAKNEAYFKQVWPKARLLIWAKPGEDAPWEDPKSWLENGKPATQIPDKDTDVLMPAAERKYFAKCPEGVVFARHMTMEKGAHLNGGDGHEFHLWGNIWVKVGAAININQCVPHGSFQTFHRNDHFISRNATGHPDGGPSGGPTSGTGHYITVKKEKAGSTEYLGCHHAADKIAFHGGTVIVGPDSCMMSGGWNRPIVLPDATYVLMSGAYTGQRLFNAGHFADDSLKVDGVLMVGTPERPLERDAFISLNYKNNATYPNARGMVVSQSGSISSYSKDPKKARLVFRWSGVDEEVDTKGLYSGADVPRRINVSILGKSQLDSVVFMDLERGGIQLADPGAKTSWKNITFGTNCDGTGDDFYSLATKKVVAKKKPVAAGSRTSGGSGKAACETQFWEPARVLVWARPGQDGDPGVAANWLENGKPATVLPDRGCDLQLPPSDRKYTVGSPKTFNISGRHITIGKNASLSCHQAIIYGNIWILQGGSFLNEVGVILKGLNHSLVKNDNPPVKGPDGVLAVGPLGLKFDELIMQKGYVEDNSSVEVRGFVHVEKRLGLGQLINNESRQLGTKQLIVGPDSTLTWGGCSSDSRNSRLLGNVVLLSGATFQRHNNSFHGKSDLSIGAWREASIIAGTPDRPLTKDAYLGLSAIEEDGQFSLLLENNPGGNTRFEVHSTDPAKARLVVRWNGHTSDKLTKRGGKPYITVGLFNKFSLDGIMFENLAKGGLVLSDPDQVKEWKNLSFGPSCDGKAADFVRKGGPP
jgi:hypothetical protein